MSHQVILQSAASSIYGAFAMLKLERASAPEFEAAAKKMDPQTASALRQRRALLTGLQAQGYALQELGTAWHSVLAKLPEGMRRAVARPLVSVAGFDAVSSSVEVFKRGAQYAIVYPDNRVRHVDEAGVRALMAR